MCGVANTGTFHCRARTEGKWKKEDGRGSDPPSLRKRKRRGGEECLRWFPTVSETADIRSKAPSPSAGPQRDVSTLPVPLEYASAADKTFPDWLGPFCVEAAAAGPRHSLPGGTLNDTCAEE